MDSSESGALVRAELSSLQLIIAASDDLAHLKSLRDKAEAVRAYARSAVLGLELLNDAAELKIRAERKVGAALAELHLRGGDRRSSAGKFVLTLKQLGLTRNQSHTWQLESAVPDDAFEKLVSDLRSRGKEITTAAVLRLARRYQPCRSGADSSRHGRALDILTSIDNLLAADRRFACLLITPPWNACHSGTQAQHDDENSDLAKLLNRVPLPRLCTPNGHIHLWCNEESVALGRQLLKKWGCKALSRFICVSQYGSYGPHWRISHSHLMLGVRGTLSFRDNSLPSWLEVEHTLGLPNVRQIYEILERTGQSPFLHIFGDHAAANWTIAKCAASDRRIGTSKPHSRAKPSDRQ